MTPEQQKMIDENRARYHALKAAAQLESVKTLPELDAKPAPALTPDQLIAEDVIPGGWAWSGFVKSGQAVRLINGAGGEGVACMIWSSHDRSERLNPADSIKIQWTAALRSGRLLFSDMGRVLASITRDSWGRHDAIAGCSSPFSNQQKYGDEKLRNSRENFLLLAMKHGMSRRDLGPVVNFFADIRCGEDGSLAWGASAGEGDFVELRAEMEILIAFSNCPHPLSPSPHFAPPPIRIQVFDPGTIAEDDLCRTLSAEAKRGFANNKTIWKM